MMALSRVVVVGVMRHGCILKIDPIRLANTLDMESKKKRKLQNDSKIFGLRK